MVLLWEILLLWKGWHVSGIAAASMRTWRSCLEHLLSVLSHHDEFLVSYIVNFSEEPVWDPVVLSTAFSGAAGMASGRNTGHH
jgi:hypothetical protein